MARFKFNFNSVNVVTVFFLSALFFQKSQGSSNVEELYNDNNVCSRSLNILGLSTIPTDLITFIGHHLGERDFLYLTHTSKQIKQSLLQDKSLFINVNSEEELVKLIRNLDISNIKKFFFSFSRNLTTQKIFQLKNLLTKFNDHDIYPNLTEQEAELKTENLKMSIKIHRLLGLANYNQSKESLINIKEDKLREIKTIHNYINDKISVLYIAKQAFLVFPKVKGYLLSQGPKQIFDNLGISITSDITGETKSVKSEESLVKWIPQISSIDDQF